LLIWVFDYKTPSCRSTELVGNVPYIDRPSRYGESIRAPC
jgi:hypothetical protein